MAQPAPVAVQAPTERNDTAPAKQTVGEVIAATAAPARGRFAPALSLADIAASRGGLGDRGGRGFGDRGARRGGRGAGGSTSELAVRMARDPALPPAAPNAVVSTVNPQQPSQLQQQQQRQQPQQVQQPQPLQQPQQQPGTRTFADAIGLQLEPLNPFPGIPTEVLACVGLQPGAVLPQLPKLFAERYEMGGVPFVTRGTRNFDTIDGFLREEPGFKRGAMTNASRTIIVRSKVVIDQPYIFIWDVHATTPAAMLQTRLTMTTLAPVGEIPMPDDFPRPPSELQDDSAWYLLQGPLAQLKAHAKRVSLRGVVAGQADHNRIYEAVGVPCTEKWREHLLGAPLHLVQENVHAPRRATVKVVYDEKATLIKRFSEAGEFHLAYSDHLVGCYMSGFNIRVILKQAFTNDYKRFLAANTGVASVFTDVKPPPTPVRVTPEEPTPNELDIIAQTVLPTEAAVHAGIITAAVPPDGLFTKIAETLKMRLLGASSSGAVFAVERGRAKDFEAMTVAGWVQLSSHRLG